MAEFKEELVINALHPEKAEVGKKYWYSDNAYRLKIKIEHNSTAFVGKLEDVDLSRSNPFPFIFKDCVGGWEYIYPYEEPLKLEIEYVPFDTVEELIDSWNKKQEKLYPKHQHFNNELEMPLIWVKEKTENQRSLITDYDFEKNTIELSYDSLSLTELFNEFTFLDGTPIGKIKE